MQKHAVEHLPNAQAGLHLTVRSELKHICFEKAIQAILVHNPC